MKLVTTKYKLVENALFLVFWVLAVYNCIVQELTGAENHTVDLLGRLFGQGMLILLGLWTLRKKTDIAVIAVFCLFTLIGTCWVNGHGLFVWVDGLRLYVGFLFLPPIIRYLLSDKELWTGFVARMDRNLYRFLWLQFPVMIIERLHYYNLDLIGGTLGYMHSGIISNLIYLISFYLMLRQWDKSKGYLENLREHWVLILLLFPSLLNETKVSFIFLLMYFFLLVPMDRKFIKRILWIAPLIVVAFMGALYVYSQSLGGKAGDMEDMASMTKYVIGDEAALNAVEWTMEREMMDENAEVQDLIRGLKFVIMPAIMDRNPPAWVWGYGLGLYKIGDAAQGHPYAKRYQWLMMGTMMQGLLFWLEVGLVGVAMYLLYFPLELRLFKRRLPRSKQLQWFLGVNALLIGFYNSAFLSLPFCIIFIYMMLVSSIWDTLPPYKPVKILGSRPINWSLKEKKEAPQG